MIFDIIAIILAYLLGSVSTSIILSKLTNSPDPRSQGSGNAGATNVLRISGKSQAIIVLVGDLLKGIIAVGIGHLMDVHGYMLGLVAFAAVLGHVFPIYFNFKGGKGLATMIGVVFALSFWSGLICLAAWVGVAAATRYSSLASLIAAILAPFLTLIFVGHQYYMPLILVTALIIYKHSANIQRLRNGTESKINF